MSETSNVETARRGYEAIARGDVEAIAELLHPDVRWHGGDPDAEGACHNREQALRFMQRRRTWDRIGELVEIVDAGDRVVVIMRPPSTGPEQPPLHANLTTFSDGKVVEMVHYADPRDALRAAGV